MIEPIHVQNFRMRMVCELALYLGCRFCPIALPKPGDTAAVQLPSSAGKLASAGYTDSSTGHTDVLLEQKPAQSMLTRTAVTHPRHLCGIRSPVFR